MKKATITLANGKTYEIHFNDWNGPNDVPGKQEDTLTLKGVGVCQVKNGTFEGATINYNGFPVKTRSLEVTVLHNSVKLVYLKA